MMVTRQRVRTVATLLVGIAAGLAIASIAPARTSQAQARAGTPRWRCFNWHDAPTAPDTESAGANDLAFNLNRHASEAPVGTTVTQGNYFFCTMRY